MSKLRNYLLEHTNPPVFFVSGIVALAFVVWGSVAPAQVGRLANTLMEGTTAWFGWWYLLVVFGFLVFALILLFSPYGRIRIGKPDEKPEWSTWAWFSMLFTAGMGIGLVFYGVAEPIFHLANPDSPDLAARTPEAAVRAMQMTFFHWGLHAWGIYIILGLSLGYFCFRHDMPLRPAAAFYPLIGDRIFGWPGNVVDILAVFGTLFGLATSLGLGATQINAGLASVFGLPVGPLSQVAIIGVVTAIAVVSVMLGLDKGIRRLSVWNMGLAIALAVIVFVVGPTVFILEYLIQSAGQYIQDLPATSLRSFAFSDEGAQWAADWTLFYWGWWISWSPFVGMFIARISRGRTIRQFVLGTLLAPVGASMVWFATFGGTAIQYIMQEGNEALSNAGTTDALFTLIYELPLPEWFAVAMSLVAILVVAIFFATSSDSGSFVVDMLTNGGDPNPIWQQRLFWAVLEGVIAAVLLVGGFYAGQGEPLSALQTAAITTGLPFSVVLVFTCWGLMRQLASERPPPPLGAVGHEELEPAPAGGRARRAEADAAGGSIEPAAQAEGSTGQRGSGRRAS